MKHIVVGTKTPFSEVLFLQCFYFKLLYEVCFYVALCDVLTFIRKDDLNIVAAMSLLN